MFIFETFHEIKSLVQQIASNPVSEDPGPKHLPGLTEEEIGDLEEVKVIASLLKKL